MMYLPAQAYSYSSRMGGADEGKGHTLRKVTATEVLEEDDEFEVR